MSRNTPFALRIAHKRTRVANISDQARANKTSTGDLQKKLDAQKRQTREQTLKDAAAERRSDREVKQNMEALAHN
jgi:hypothetical protein